jgi:hypothetical protein
MFSLLSSESQNATLSMITSRRRATRMIETQAGTFEPINVCIPLPTSPKRNQYYDVFSIDPSTSMQEYVIGLEPFENDKPCSRRRPRRRGRRLEPYIVNRKPSRIFACQY